MQIRGLGRAMLLSSTRAMAVKRRVVLRMSGQLPDGKAER